MIRDKYRYVATHLDRDATSLLDVGCRDAVLSTYLRKDLEYTGVDLMPGPKVTRVCNLEQGLPFEDRSFDAVTALDILEHTENIWANFGELVRVTRRQLFIVLPNLYWWPHRLRYLAGAEQGKYRLDAHPIEDRHRWLTSYESARRFATGMAEKHNLTLQEELVSGGRRTIVPDTLLSLFSKNLGSWAVMYVFRPRSG